jgi:hypothetical protein
LKKDENEGTEPKDKFWSSFYPTEQFTTKFKKSKRNEMQLVKLDLSVLRRVKVLCERSILVYFNIYFNIFICIGFIKS